MEEKIGLRDLPPTVQMILLIDAYGAHVMTNQILPYIHDRFSFSGLVKLVLQLDGDTWIKSFPVLGGGTFSKDIITIEDVGGIAGFGRIVLSKDGGFTAMPSCLSAPALPESRIKRFLRRLAGRKT